MGGLCLLTHGGNREQPLIFSADNGRMDRSNRVVPELFYSPSPQMPQPADSHGTVNAQITQQSGLTWRDQQRTSCDFGSIMTFHVCQRRYTKFHRLSTKLRSRRGKKRFKKMMAMDLAMGPIGGLVGLITDYLQRAGRIPSG